MTSSTTTTCMCPCSSSWVSNPLMLTFNVAPVILVCWSTIDFQLSYISLLSMEHCPVRALQFIARWGTLTHFIHPCGYDQRVPKFPFNSQTGDLHAYRSKIQYLILGMTLLCQNITAPTSTYQQVALHIPALQPGRAFMKGFSLLTRLNPPANTWH